MHARKSARDAAFPSPADDAFFAPRGDVVFADASRARVFAERVNDHERRSVETALRPAELAAMALVHEILHTVVGIHRARNPESFQRLLGELNRDLGSDSHATLVAFLRTFPTPEIYAVMRERGEASRDPRPKMQTPKRVIARDDAAHVFAEELLLLWLTNQNPAYAPVRSIVSDEGLGPAYPAFIQTTRKFFANEPSISPGGENLVDLLLAPSRAAPHSIFAQLEWMGERWGESLGLAELPIWRRMAWAHAFLAEEGRYFMRGGPGMAPPRMEPMRFGDTPMEEPKRFSHDLDWMPRVVLVAKTAYVWLDQLSKQYGRAIERLDQIPDEELDRLAARGFTGLWLIGLFERSRASKKIKQMRGAEDAVASAYSLKSYDIAADLGGTWAYQNLRDRAWARGIRLAADMVPNHVGIDADWVMNHPDWFLRAPHPPFPAYRFGGENLSEDPRTSVFIEEGYWNNTDASVVFRRHDNATGEDRYLYHGNDGTSMPWNDTAQLDYTKAEVRHAVIETILHVARMFPIIRFDAAMTLAKRHYKRLWFPFPGATDAIPSRADHAMTQEEFDRVFPEEFWREVVDTVKERAPDTLLLAEAFWMMEGYFVRSLGMHRVYNSAFMNMLKREENQKYRETIKNVLDFDPEILKRFVNFMNNPDEDTAVAQFGSDDKYFGVATLMSTMPGLPMFGHGQIEGFHEKYGMEYRRAKWDEQPNGWLVARHEREIFPLLHRRWLFSGVEGFQLYDFVAEGGGVDEDVYAYSNRVGDARGLVLFNNKFKSTRGTIGHAAPKRGEDGNTRGATLAHALGISSAEGDWLLFRDVSNQLEYIRSTREVEERGLQWHLDAFKYHAFVDIHTANATDDLPLDKLAAELNGRGVPSIAQAIVDLRLRPIHAPLREALGRGHIDWLASSWDPKTHAPTEDGLASLAEKLRHFADGLAWMQGTEVDEAALANAVAHATRRMTSLLRMSHATATDPTTKHLRDDGPGTFAAKTTTKEQRLAETRLLFAWIHIEAALDLLGGGRAPRSPTEDGASRSGTERPTTKERDDAGTLARWELAMPLLDALSADHPPAEAQRQAALVLLAATLPTGPLREIVDGALSDPRAKEFLGVHTSGDVVWLVQERYDELAQLLAQRDVVEGRASLALAHRQADDLQRLGAKSGYRAEVLHAWLTVHPGGQRDARPETATAPSSARRPPV